MDNVDSHAQHSGNHRGRLYVRMMAAFCSLLLLLISLMLVSVNTDAATRNALMIRNSSVAVTQANTATVPGTTTATDTPTPTATNTPTPTPTNTPTPTPTATPRPSPTPTATTTKPTPTPKAGSTPSSSVATATPGPGVTPTARTTPAVVPDQTPTATAVTGIPTTTTNNGGGSNTPTTPPPAAPSSSGLSMPKIIIGLLFALGLISAIMIVLVVLRNRLLPPLAPNNNLPPSGAKPWQRWRAGSSFNGIVNNNNQGFNYSATTMQNIPTQPGASAMSPSMNPMFANTNNASGFPPPQQWDQTVNASGFPPPPRSNSANDNGFPPPPRGNSNNANGFPPPQQWGNSS